MQLRKSAIDSSKYPLPERPSWQHRQGNSFDLDEQPYADPLTQP
jgi:hypothetical protein